MLLTHTHTPATLYIWLEDFKQGKKHSQTTKHQKITVICKGSKPPAFQWEWRCSKHSGLLVSMHQMVWTQGFQNTISQCRRHGINRCSSQQKMKDNNQLASSTSKKAQINSWSYSRPHLTRSTSCRTESLYVKFGVNTAAVLFPTNK